MKVIEVDERFFDGHWYSRLEASFDSTAIARRRSSDSTPLTEAFPVGLLRMRSAEVLGLNHISCDTRTSRMSSSSSSKMAVAPSGSCA